jgi:hypothetical protein
MCKQADLAPGNIRPGAADSRHNCKGTGSVMDNLESMSAGKVITETLTDVVSWICNVDGWHRWSDLGSRLVN